MIDILIKEGRVPSKQKSVFARCDASIPLTFIKISPAAVRSLAAKCKITTVEDLYRATKEKICDHIRDRQIRRDIFALKDQINKKVASARFRNILLFDERARARNIKVKPDQRAELIGVALFSTLMRKVEDVIKYVLDTNDAALPHRKRALLVKLKHISLRSVVRA